MFTPLLSLFKKPDHAAGLNGAPRTQFWNAPERAGWLMKQGEHIKTWRAHHTPVPDCGLVLPANRLLRCTPPERSGPRAAIGVLRTATFAEPSA